MNPLHKLARKKLIIGVMTCPKYAYRANGIRRTWLKGLPPNMKVLFVFGQPGQNPRLEKDLLYLDCQEAYENLPEKVFRFFEFCYQNMDFDYILKVDDDSYLHMERLLKFDTQAADYIGLLRGFGDPAVTRTWHYGKCEDKSLEVPYQGEYVCDWARGGGYLLSRKAVSVVVEKVANTFQNHLFEDKMVGEALTLDERIQTLHRHYVEMGILNPMPPHNMQFVHEHLASQTAAQAGSAAADTPVGAVNFGTLRRLAPISRKWGFDRGTPIDRYYIESFLEHNAACIRGRVLEVKDRAYTSRYGGSQVSVSEVLDIDENNHEASMIADITRTESFEAGAFDCAIFTQTIQLIDDPMSAIASLHKLLKPEGTLLLTCPGITRIQTRGPESNWYWSFTPLSLRMLCERHFDGSNVVIAAHGNVFAATCFLWGISVEEISTDELDFVDADYPLLLTLRATKA